MIPDELNISLEDSVRKCRTATGLEANPVAQTIIEQGRVIEGMVRNTGKHACGVIIADQDITNLIGALQEGDLTTRTPRDRRRPRPARDGLPRAENAHRHRRRTDQCAGHPQLDGLDIEKSRSPTSPPLTCSTAAAPRPSSSWSPAVCSNSAAKSPAPSRKSSP